MNSWANAEEKKGVLYKICRSIRSLPRPNRAHLLLWQNRSNSPLVLCALLHCQYEQRNLRRQNGAQVTFCADQSIVGVQATAQPCRCGNMAAAASRLMLIAPSMFVRIISVTLASVARSSRLSCATPAALTTAVKFVLADTRTVLNSCLTLLLSPTSTVAETCLYKEGWGS